MIAAEYVEADVQPASAPPGKQKRPIERRGLGYVWEAEQYGIRVIADYLRERSDELTAELCIESTLAGLPSHLHQARVNLTSGTSRSALARHLNTLTGKERIPWQQLLERFC